MLCETLQACREDRVALATPDGVTTWRSLHAEIEQRIESLDRLQSQRLAVRLPATSAAVATLAALDALGCHLFLSVLRTCRGRSPNSQVWRLLFGEIWTNEWGMTMALGKEPENNCSVQKLIVSHYIHNLHLYLFFFMWIFLAFYTRMHQPVHTVVFRHLSYQ